MLTPEISQRLIDLESTVAHLEHELQQMHTVLLAVQADLTASRERMTKFEEKLLLATEQSDERSPLDEKPPHY